MTNVIAGNLRLVKVNKKPAFSGLSARTERVEIPAGRYDFLNLTFKYTVTSASLSAGMNINGVIKELYLADGSFKHFYVEGDELVTLIKMQTRESEAGRYYDPDPTTAVECTAHFLIEGPFDLRDADYPELIIGLKAPADEFTSASAFEAVVDIKLIPSNSDGDGIVWQRISSPTSQTEHTFAIGDYTVSELFLLSTQAMTKLQLPSGKDGKIIPNQFDLDFSGTEEVEFFRGVYQAEHNLAAPVAGTYLVTDMYNIHYAAREAKVTLATAGTLKGFAKNHFRVV